MSHNNKGATKKKSNQNYSTSLAGGGSVSVKNGVKTYSDKAQTVSGNNGISISGKSYSRDKGGTGFAPITPEQLNSSTPAFTLPKETVTNFTDPTANYGGFTGGDSSLTTQNGQLVTATPLPTADNKYGSITDTFNKIMAEQAKIAPPSGGDIQRQLEKETKINQLRKQEANYSNQLNTITANRDANVLRVEGQGRGIPEAIIGGQQAKINKEAAIQALPVQAQLAAAQGNVALAEAHINTWGKILMDDATNQYNYKKDLLKSVGDFALNIESKKIDDLNLKIEQKYKSEQALVTAKVEAQKMALGQGAPSAISDAIRAATTLEEVATATGKYNADILGQEAQRANIAQSRASTANSYSAIREREAATAAAIEANKPIEVFNDPKKTLVENNMSTLSSIMGSGKISATNKTTIGAGLALAKAVSDLADSNSAGEFTGLYPGRSVIDFITPEAFKREKTIKNEALISALDLQTQFWASGAALSDAQTELVQKMIPTKSDTDKAVQTKANNLVNYMLSQTASRLITDGVEYTPLKVDLFEAANLYKGIDKSQEEALRAKGLII
jgi:hypothetical protein